MKVTKELIEKYVKGLCTEEERQEIEAWLPGERDIDSFLPEEFVVAEQERMWDEIASGTPMEKDLIPEVIPIYKSIIKYAAASIVVGMFGAITFFLYTKDTNEMVSVNEKKEYEIVLCHRNNHKIYLKLDKSFGERKEQIKITNISLLPKCIKVGKDSKVVLTIKPHQTYYLTGTYDNPYLIKA